MTKIKAILHAMNCVKEQGNYTWKQISDYLGIGQSTIHVWFNYEAIGLKFDKDILWVKLDNLMEEENMVGGGMRTRIDTRNMLVEGVEIYTDKVEEVIMMLTDQKVIIMNEMNTIRDRLRVLESQDQKYEMAITTLRDLTSESTNKI